MAKVVKKKVDAYKSKGSSNRNEAINNTAKGVQNKRNSTNEIHEPHAHYGGAIPALYHGRTYNTGFWSSGLHVVPAAEKITIIKKGISKRELESIKEQSDLDYESLSSILSVSKAKLHSKKGAEKFDQNTSERIMLLA